MSYKIQIPWYNFRTRPVGGIVPPSPRLSFQTDLEPKPPKGTSKGATQPSPTVQPVKVTMPSKANIPVAIQPPVEIPVQIPRNAPVDVPVMMPRSRRDLPQWEGARPLWEGIPLLLPKESLLNALKAIKVGILPLKVLPDSIVSFLNFKVNALKGLSTAAMAATLMTEEKLNEMIEFLEGERQID